MGRRIFACCHCEGNDSRCWCVLRCWKCSGDSAAIAEHLPNQNPALQQLGSNGAAPLFTRLQCKEEYRLSLSKPRWHFPPKSAYPFRLWSLGRAGKQEALFRKQGIIKSNLSTVETKKLVVSFLERRNRHADQLSKQFLFCPGMLKSLPKWRV